MLKIPIVLASDKNCASQMYTTILSAIDNKSENSFYDFYCLVPNKFSKRVTKLFYRLIEKNHNVNLTFVNMKNAFSDIEMQISHITSPTFYRLKIAELLPQYEKVLYLDIDTVVLQDLKELYKTDLGENYIGGVHSASYVINEKNTKQYYDSIGIPDMKYYINAGVILWNLKQIRKENITSKLLAMCKNQYRFMDQDIINLVCYGKIKHLDFKYNVMTSFKSRFLDVPELSQKVYDCYGKENVENAIIHPVIIHYVSDEKPWNNKNIWLGKYWQYYAKKNPIKFKRIPTMEQRFIEQVNEYKFKKVVFWGASVFLSDLILSGKIKKRKILGIVDKSGSRWGERIGDLEIYSPNDLVNLKPDVIIFAIKNNNTQIYNQVKTYLEEKFFDIKFLSNSFNKK